MYGLIALLLAAAPSSKEAVVGPSVPVIEPFAVLGGAAWLADGEVSTVAWSPDGKLLASGGASDQSIVLWDPAGRRVRSLGPKTKPVHLAFSQDGRFLVSTNLYNADVWEVATGRRVASVDSVHHAALSADGKRLVTAGLEGLRLWSLPEGKLEPLAGAIDSSGPVVLSANGTLLVAAKRLGGLALWDLGARTPPREVGRAHASAMALHGDLLLCGEDGSLVVRDAKTGAVRATHTGHKGKLYGLAVSADGLRAATADSEGAARLWDLAAGKPLQALEAGFPVWGAALAPDGSAMAVAGRSRQLKVWRGPSFGLEGGEPVHADGVRGLAFTPDGGTLLSGDSSGRLVEWDAKEWKVRRRFASTGHAVAEVAMRPDGAQALVLGYSEAWRWVPGAKDLSAAPGLGPGARWSPDGRVLALSDSTRIVRLVDAATGRPLRTLGASQPHDAERQNLMTPSSTAFSPDGRQLAVARWDQPLAIWDVASGAQLRTVPGTLHVEWSPDGRTLAVDLGRVSKRMTKLDLSVLDAETGQARYVAPYPDARFSPDGRFLAALDEGGVVLLEAGSGKVLTRLFAEGHRPGAFAFSADGKTLATGGEDATVRVFRVP